MARKNRRFFWRSVAALGEKSRLPLWADRGIGLVIKCRAMLQSDNLKPSGRFTTTGGNRRRLFARGRRRGLGGVAPGRALPIIR